MGHGAEIEKLVESALHFNAPGRFIDVLIMQEVMGLPVRMVRITTDHFIYQPTPGGIWESVPYYSTDRGDALALLKHLIPDYRGKPPGPGSPLYLVHIEGQTGGAATWPLAVCKAALRAAGLYEPKHPLSLDMLRRNEEIRVKPN